MYDPFRESREQRLNREIQETKEAKELAEQQLQISQLAFVFGDIRIDVLGGFKGAKSAFIYDETDEGTYYSEFDMKNEAVMNDIAGSSFKVGDRFVCRVREAMKDGKKEIWLQYKFNKMFFNLYDPNRYFYREVDSAKVFLLVKSDGITMIFTSSEELPFDKARKVLAKISKSIINYDKNGYAVVKKSARQA